MTRGVFSAFLLSLSAVAAAAGWGHHGMNVQVRYDGAPATCQDLQITIDDRPAARAEHTMTLVQPSNGPLRIRSPRNSGTYVEASDRRDAQLLVCKGAASNADLDQVRVTFENGLLTATGPATDSWVAYFLIQAPQAAILDVEAGNGPIGLEGLTGKVSARSQNGPIALKNCSGTIDAEAQNGPISVAGSGGDVRVRTQNGPISVKLAGNTWEGAGLVASAVNGPVSLKIPDGYRSGAVVESAGHSPFRCKGGACNGARSSWDDDGRRLQIGGGASAVHLSTVNGPVTVASSDRDEE